MAFQSAVTWRRERGAEKPLILDSGCGTGRSSVALSRRHPEALVIGLDKSEARLQRAGRRFDLPENLLLLRADCGVFWLLAGHAGWRLSAHHLLYPNPWPKPAHLKRRWHGHPAFPALLHLGGWLQVRTNWRPYLEEFRLALTVAGKTAGSILHVPDAGAPLTDFEAKYQASGQQLFRLDADLG